MGSNAPREGRAERLGTDAYFRAAPAQRRRRVMVDHVRILYRLSHLSAVVSVAVVVLLALALYGKVSDIALVVWCLAVLLVAAGRFQLSRAYTRCVGDCLTDRRWGWAAAAGAFLQGVTWSSLLLVVDVADPSSSSLAMFLVCAMGFGAFSTLGFYLPAFLGFLLPVVAGLFLWFFLFIPDVTLWSGALLILGSAVLTQAAIRASRVLRGALLLSAEQDDRARQAAAESEEMQITLGAIGDGVLSTDRKGLIRWMNPTAERLTGWTVAEARGLRLGEVLRSADADEQERLESLWQSAMGQLGAEALVRECRIQARGGETSSLKLRASPIRDRDGPVRGVLLVLHDVTAMMGLERSLRYQAEHDAVTGLYNRSGFEQRLLDAVERSRADGWVHALCYLDLDQFKVINDTCGHAAGDELLRELADRIGSLIRESDVLARLGGDEFGLLLYRCPPERALKLAEHIIATIRAHRFQWGEDSYTVGVSIGLLAVDGSQSGGELLAAADAACYVAKEQGRNRIHVVNPDDTALATRHGEMQLTTRIQRALDENRLRLRYQKIMPLNGAASLKTEFLLSMEDPEGALLAPAEFLGAAERYQMMPQIDRHVIRLALDYIAAGLPELAEVDLFAINLSGQSFADADFLDFVLAAITASGVSPERLCFEITETAVIADHERALAFMARLRAQGCRFALDDFGSGLSSFGYLRRLPVDFLKIDGQFVCNMCEDPINRSMVEAIHQVGHTMGLETVAEFVEHQHTARELQAMGVDYAQGWGLHKPALLPRLSADGADRPRQPLRR